jgi:hypothetical protein
MTYSRFVRLIERCLNGIPAFCEKLSCIESTNLRARSAICGTYGSGSDKSSERGRTMIREKTEVAPATVCDTYVRA